MGIRDEHSHMITTFSLSLLTLVCSFKIQLEENACI